MKMNQCECENWSIQDLSDALQNMHKGNKRIVVPMFQRGKRWSKIQEDKFIDSLKNGYPVGTMLFYGHIENGVQTYILVDGLQRGNCIKKFITKPTLFIDSTNIPDSLCHKILDILNQDTNDNIEKIKDILTSFIKENNTYNENTHLLDVIENILSYFQIDCSKNPFGYITPINNIISAFLKEKLELYNTIAKSIIPIIVYSGDEDNLPEIFDRINSQGTPLDQYEVYAASWPIDIKFRIENDETVENVIKKYETLKLEGYQLHNYNKDKIRENHLLNSFEYLFGLSKFLVNRYDTLRFNTSKGDDEVNPLAFELVNACLNDSNKIKTLYRNLSCLDINKFENALLKSIEYVEKVIHPITSFKGNVRNRNRVFHAKYQILSMIAFTFREMFDGKNFTEVSLQWEEKRSILNVNLQHYYVYDIITNFWNDGGTNKIFTVIKNRKYLEDINSRTWMAALNSFFEKSMTRIERNRIANPNSNEYVLLNCIYLQSFTAMDQLSLEKFDIEHIAPKDQMKKLLESCHGDGLPISCISNLCYLPEFVNRSKQSKNFYQDKKYLKDQKLNEIETKYSFTQQEDLDWMDINYDKNDFKYLKEAYTDFCTKRFDILKHKICTSLGIEYTKLDTSDLINTENQHVNNLLQQLSKILHINNNVILQQCNKLTYKTPDNKIGFVFRKSKPYPQGEKEKYWFVYRRSPSIKECTQQLFMFICNNEKVIILSINEIEERLKMLNGSKDEDGNIIHWHIVFIKNPDGRYVWLLSRPNIQEYDVTEKVFPIESNE